MLGGRTEAKAFRRVALLTGSHSLTFALSSFFATGHLIVPDGISSHRTELRHTVPKHASWRESAIYHA